jgi:hypothetical protein
MLISCAAFVVFSLSLDFFVTFGKSCADCWVPYSTVGLFNSSKSATHSLVLLPPSLNISIPRVPSVTQETTVGEMTSIPFILHYPPTLHPPTHQPIYFCLIYRNNYILTQILNPRNAYIKKRREYVDLYSSIFYSAELQQEGNRGLALVAGAETLEEARTEISSAGGGGRGRLGICPSTSHLVLAVA